MAIVAANSAEYALLMWATATLGAVVASLNGWWTGPELHFGIELSRPVLIAGDERRGPASIRTRCRPGCR